MYFIGDEEIEALKKLFSKKKLYRHQSYTSECDHFEKEFSDYIGVPHSLLLTSGTNALLLSLLAAGIQTGDEVLIPAYTFVATAAAVIQAGAIPIIVNIDKNLSLDITDAKNKISARTKALILVHMDGLVANVVATEKFCAEHSIVFIEDVAQAIGASYDDGKKIGSFGAFGCFSLNENKNISCGEGGILITKERMAFEKAFCLHDGPVQFNPSKKEFFTEITPFMGYSMRVSEIQGAIMRVQLTRLEFILNELRKRKSVLLESLQAISGVECITGYSVGECASSLHLQFADAEKGAFYGKALRAAGFVFLPVTNRPAHASWKWSHLLGGKAHLQQGLNPYLRTDKKYSYPISDYLQSVDILTQTLKMEIDINLSVEDTKKSGQKMRDILKGNHFPSAKP